MKDMDFEPEVARKIAEAVEKKHVKQPTLRFRKCGRCFWFRNDNCFNLLTCDGSNNFKPRDDFGPYDKTNVLPDGVEVVNDTIKMPNGVTIDSAGDLKVKEMVNHPDHYNSGGVEVIDVIEAFTDGLNGIEASDTGNIIKYACRWHQKNGVEDLKKIRWYVNHLIDYLEGRKNGK